MQILLLFSVSLINSSLRCWIYSRRVINALVYNRVPTACFITTTSSAVMRASRHSVKCVVALLWRRLKKKNNLQPLNEGLALVSVTRSSEKVHIWHDKEPQRMFLLPTKIKRETREYKAGFLQPLSTKGIWLPNSDHNNNDCICILLFSFSIISF